MKFQVNPGSRLAKAIGLLSNIGVELSVKPFAQDVTRRRVEELEVFGRDKVEALGELLDHIQGFDEVVREKVNDMSVGERHEEVRQIFKSILDDLERQVKSISKDGKVGLMDRVREKMMEVRRGTVQSRFNSLRATVESVFADTAKQLETEMAIHEAYQEFRMGMKEGTAVSEHVRDLAEARKNEFATALSEAQRMVDEARANGVPGPEVTRLEIARDQARIAAEKEDRRYQTALDLHEQLLIGYGISDAVMTRLAQTTQVKDAQQRKATTFYTANQGAITVLSVAFTATKGLHESTQTQKALQEGLHDALGRINSLGNDVQVEALKAAYGSTFDPTLIKNMYEQAVKFEISQRSEITKLREVSSKNAAEINRVIEEGQRKLARALAEGSTPKTAASSDVGGSISLEIPAIGAEQIEKNREENAPVRPALKKASAAKP